MSRLDRARGTGDQAVPADAVQDRLPAKGGQLLAGHVVPDERGRAVHQVTGDRTAAVQAEHHDAVQFPAPQRQPMTAVQRQEESDNVLQVNTTAALNVTTTYVCRGGDLLFKHSLSQSGCGARTARGANDNTVTAFGGAIYITVGFFFLNPNELYYDFRKQDSTFLGR